MATGDPKVPTSGGKEESTQTHLDSDLERALYYAAAEESHVFLDRVIDIGETMDTAEALILYRHFCPEEKQKNGIIHEKNPGLRVINYLRSEKIISITDISALETAAVELNLIHLAKKIEEHKRILALPVLPIKVKNSGQHSLLENSLTAFRRNKTLRRFFRERYNANFLSCRKGCLSLRLAVSSTISLEKLRTDIQSGVLAKELHSKFGFQENIKISFDEKLYNDIHQQLTLQDSMQSKTHHREDVKLEGKPMSTDHSPKSENKEIVTFERAIVCEKHGAWQEVFCLTCYAHLCYACVYECHRDHHVVSLNEMEVNIQDQTQKMHTEIRKVEEQLKILETAQKVFEEKIHKPIELELHNFVEESVKIMKVQQEGLTKFVHDITELGVMDLEHMKMTVNDTDKEVFFSKEKIEAKLHHDNLTQLCELNKLETEIKESEKSINIISHKLKRRSLAISVRPTSISARLAYVSYGCILGAVRTGEEQMVVIRRQDNPNTLYNLTCTSCYDPKLCFWEYTFECKVGPYPIVVANTLHICSREMGILVGCGNNVSILRVTESNNCLFFVEKKSCFDVSIPKDSHITGISPVKGKMQDTGIIVSDEKSGILQLFDNKYQQTKKVIYPGNFPLITCFPRGNEYRYALAALNAESVGLAASNSAEGIPREFAKLRLAKNSKLHAQSLFFDGSFITVLWVSREETYGQGQDWKVIAYKDDGQEVNVSKEGKCEPNVTAVSISHIKNEAVLCFSNGTVDLFQTFRT